MKDSGTKAKEMDMVFLQREMEITSKAIGSMITARDKAHISIVIRTSSSSESGLKTSQKLEYIPKSRMKMPTRAQNVHTSRILTFSLQFPN